MIALSLSHSVCLPLSICCIIRWKDLSRDPNHRALSGNGVNARALRAALKDTLDAVARNFTTNHKPALNGIDELRATQAILSSQKRSGPSPAKKRRTEEAAPDPFALSLKKQDKLLVTKRQQFDKLMDSKEEQTLLLREGQQILSNALLMMQPDDYYLAQLEHFVESNMGINYWENLRELSSSDQKMLSRSMRLAVEEKWTEEKMRDYFIRKIGYLRENRQ